MNEPHAQQPVDITTLTRDEALLDALGRGDPPPADDEVAVMLAAWRADLAADLPAVPAVRPAAVSDAPTEPAVPARPGRRRRVLVRMAGTVAAALVGIAGAVTLAASNAAPGSPLWPITKVVYEERAESRAAAHEAERTIAQAREAAAESRYSDAARLLDEATTLVGRVRDERLAQRLLAEIEALRGLLPGLIGSVTPSAPPGATPTATPNPGGSAPAAGTPAPDPSASGGSGLLPDLPLPSLPLPDLPLPSAPPTIDLPLLPPLPPLLAAR
jgi:hypothetical protein